MKTTAMRAVGAAESAARAGAEAGAMVDAFDTAASAVVAEGLRADEAGARGAAASFWWRLGYDYIGRIYYGFTAWLIEEAARERVSHLYFLARDGQVLLRALELFRARGVAAPTASYLYVSRRSLTFPALSGSDASLVTFVTDARRLVSGAELSVADYLGRIGIDVTAYPQAIGQAGFSGPDDPVRDEQDIARLVKLVRLLRWPIQACAVAERNLLRRYLDQECFFDRGKIGVVDVGWYGSMQYALVDIANYLGRPLDIAGFYLGTYDDAKYRHLNMHGYVIDREQPSRRLPLIWEADGFIEFMLSGRHASVINYSDLGGQVVPHLGSEPVNDYRMAAAVELQEGALAFVAAMLERFGQLPADVDVALRPLERLIFQPTSSEVETIGDIEHHETLGDGHRTRFFARPRPDLDGSLDLGQVFADYEQAFWKVGYLRRSRAGSLVKGLLATARVANRVQRLGRRRLARWARRRRPSVA